jgi:hypothetical protein
MNYIDHKLRLALEDFANKRHVDLSVDKSTEKTYQEATEQIINIFKDFGFEQPVDLVEKGLILQSGVDNSFYFAGNMHVFKEANGLMTAQEFFDRFTLEGVKAFTEPEPPYAPLAITWPNVLKVAKRASGLDDTQANN